MLTVCSPGLPGTWWTSVLLSWFVTDLPSLLAVCRRFFHLVTSLCTLLFCFGFSAEGFTSVPCYKNHSHQAQGCYFPFCPAMNTENAVPGHREGGNTESTKCILLPFPDLFQLICCNGFNVCSAFSWGGSPRPTEVVHCGDLAEPITWLVLKIYTWLNHLKRAGCASVKSLLRPGKPMESSLASGFRAGNWVQAGPVGAGPGLLRHRPLPGKRARPCAGGAPSQGDQAPIPAETIASFIFFWWCLLGHAAWGHSNAGTAKWLGAGWEWPAAGTGAAPRPEVAVAVWLGLLGWNQHGSSPQPRLSRRGSQWTLFA